MNGRLTDVLIEDDLYTDPQTGLQYFGSLTVWADAGMKDTIKGVEGVANVFNGTSDVSYTVFVDPRYDREYVKREIEAAIRCA